MKHIETSMVHLNEPDKRSGAIIPPIYLSTTFNQKAPGVTIVFDTYINVILGRI